MFDILEPIFHLGRTTADRNALFSSGQPPSTFADLAKFSLAACQRLDELGIGRSARIATLLSDGAETAVALLCVSAYATAVPINPKLKAPETLAVLQSADVDYIIADDRNLSQARAAATELAISLILLSPIIGGSAGTFTLTAAALLPARPAARAISSADVGLVLHTSGSTGLPKRVPLTRSNLIHSARNVATSLALGETDVCLNMMPMFHIGALVDLLMAPLYAGGAVAFAQTISAEAFVAGMEAFRPTWFQAVPTVLRDFLTHDFAAPDLALFGPLRLIRAVSQPLSIELKRAVETKFGVPVIPIFGMTETAGLIASVPLDEQNREGSVGRPVGCDLKIADAVGNELAVFKRGEVLIKGPTVMMGYESVIAHEEVFRGSWFRSGDEGYVDQDGFVFLTGRIKDIINRGGEKISPREIDQVLETNPIVSEAAAFALPHPTLGEEVAVAVVAAKGMVVTEREVRQFLADRISEFKVPRKVYVLEKLPRLPSGKLDRRALPALAAAASSTDTRHRSALTPMAKTLRAAWKAILGLDDIGIDDNFFDLGGDSLTATTLMLRLEAIAGRELPASIIFDAPTIRQLELELLRVSDGAGAGDEATLKPEIYRFIRHRTAGWQGSRAYPQSLVVGQNTIGGETPLFWVCQDTREFSALRQHLHPDRPFYVMSSINSRRLRNDQTNRQLASYYARQILRIRPTGPYLLGGYCEGGRIAFQIAKSLQAMDRDVALLCLQDQTVAEAYGGAIALFAGKRGPACPYDLADQPERAWSKYYSGELSVFRLSADHNEWHEMPHVKEFADRLESEFKRISTGRLPDYQRTLARLQPIDARSTRARVKFNAPRFMRPGSEHVVRVEVTNVSPVAWEPTDKSGIIVASRWRAMDRYHGMILGSRQELQRCVEPGQRLTFELPILVPVRSLPMLLTVDLVEDGVQWFGDVGRSGCTRLVVPLPVRHRREITVG